MQSAPLSPAIVPITTAIQPPTAGRSSAERDFFAAVRRKDAHLVEEMLVHTPDLIRSCDAQRRTPLHHAVLATRPADFVEMLLRNGADPMAREERGNTALHLASTMPPYDLEVFRHLAVAGGLPLLLSTNNANLEAMECALSLRNGHVVLALGRLKSEARNLEAMAADPLADAWNSLEKTITTGLVCSMPPAVAGVGGVNAKRPGLQLTPLMAALLVDRIDMVRWLVDQGAELNAMSAKANGDPGRPCIFFAQTIDTMAYMLAAGADLFAKGSDGMTAQALIMDSHPPDIAALVMNAAKNASAQHRP
jgi:ankyrin repeat protein